MALKRLCYNQNIRYGYRARVLIKISTIMGEVANDGEISYKIKSHWETVEESRLLIDKYIKTKRVKLLRKEINLTIQEVSKLFIIRMEMFVKITISCLMICLFLVVQ